MATINAKTTAPTIVNAMICTVCSRAAPLLIPDGVSATAVTVEGSVSVSVSAVLVTTTRVVVFVVVGSLLVELAVDISAVDEIAVATDVAIDIVVGASDGDTTVVVLGAVGLHADNDVTSLFVRSKQMNDC